MEQLALLCDLIGLQDEVKKIVLDLYPEIDFKAAAPAMEQLFSKDTRKEGLSNLETLLDPDPNGFKMLTCMLVCALQTRKMYQQSGIPESVFTATLRCFPRFVGEHMASFGRYGFDRAFWTPRQIGMQLFRIDELEYELIEKNGTRTIGLHIPSDAHIQTDNVKASCQKARSFLKCYFPKYQDAPITCESWLLSPALMQVLPPTSNIRRFQELFIIDKVDEEANDVLEWVFKRTDLPYESLPEDTSLQRSLKQYLLDGKKVGIGFGTLSEARFHS